MVSASPHWSRQPPRTSDLLSLLPVSRCSLAGTSKTKSPARDGAEFAIWRLPSRSHAIIEALPQVGCRSSATPDPKIKGDERSRSPLELKARPRVDGPSGENAAYCVSKCRRMSKRGANRRPLYCTPVRMGGMERCQHCGQPLIEIDNHGERLNGCLTCNLWTAGDAEGWTRLKGWTRLSVEDLRALHQLRHGGHK